MPDLPQSFLQGLQVGQTALESADRVKLAQGEQAIARAQLGLQKEGLAFERENAARQAELQLELKRQESEDFKRLNESRERQELANREFQGQQAQQDREFTAQQNDLARRHAEDMARREQQARDEHNQRMQDIEEYRIRGELGLEVMDREHSYRMWQLGLKQKELLENQAMLGSKEAATREKAMIQMRRMMDETVRSVEMGRDAGDIASETYFSTLSAVIGGRTLQQQRFADSPAIVAKIGSGVEDVIDYTFGDSPTVEEHIAAILLGDPSQSIDFGGPDSVSERAGALAIQLANASPEERASIIGRAMLPEATKDLARALQGANPNIDASAVEIALPALMNAMASARGKSGEELAEIQARVDDQLTEASKQIGIPEETIIAAVKRFTNGAIAQAQVLDKQNPNDLRHDESRAINQVMQGTSDYFMNIRAGLANATDGKYQTPESVEALKGFTAVEFMNGFAAAEEAGVLDEYIANNMGEMIYLADDIGELVDAMAPHLEEIGGLKEDIDALKEALRQQEIQVAKEGLEAQKEFLEEREAGVDDLFGEEDDGIPEFLRRPE